MSSFPLFAPDGTVRQVPQEQLQDALNAGGKLAVKMQDPSGTLRYVPSDQVDQATQAGGKVYQAPQSYGFGTPFENTLGREIKSVGQNIAGAPNAIYHAFTDPSTPEEQSRSKGLENFPGVQGISRLVAQPLANAIDYYRNYANSTPDQRSAQQLDMLNVAPEAIGAGAASVLTGKLAESVPGAVVKGGPPVARAIIKGTNAALNKAPELVAGGAGAAIGGALGGGYGAGIGGTIGAIAGKSLPKLGRIPGENFGIPKPVYPGAPFPESPGYFPGAPYPENPGSFPGAPYPATPSSEVLQGNALSRGAQSGQPLPGAALGQIPSTQAQPAPQTPNVQAQLVQPAPSVTPQPAQMLQFDPIENSSQLAGHTFDPQTQTATMQFKNGQVHQYYGVTPEDWSNYRNQSSPGKGFQAYIKRDPATGAGRTSRPLTATSAKSAVQEAPPASANELLERYIGLF